MKSARHEVALITGAGSGIGRAVAKLLAANGTAIAAIDLRPELLQSLAEELPGKRLAWAVADVADRPALTATVRQLQEQLGSIDLVIASAGIGLETSALDFKPEVFEQVIRINLIGVANTIAVVLPTMLERKRGHIVGLSSLASFRGLPRMAGYCASKAGLNALLDTFRYELKPQGIAVTAICPGWIRTAMTAAIDFQLTNLIEPEEAARRILAAIRRRKAYHAFPPFSSSVARLLGMLPARWSDWLLNRYLDGLRAHHAPRGRQ